MVQIVDDLNAAIVQDNTDTQAVLSILAQQTDDILHLTQQLADAGNANDAAFVAAATESITMAVTNLQHSHAALASALATMGTPAPVPEPPPALPAEDPAPVLGGTSKPVTGSSMGTGSASV